MKLNIFDIKRYAINDGPGIRTTIFLKGCPLRCVWCHNPESWRVEPEVLFKEKKCIGCNLCGRFTILRSQGAKESGSQDDTVLRSGGVEECRSLDDRQNPQALDVDACPTKALERCGREWTMEELMAEIEKERDVMEDSGGGVTLCGGEPLMQPEATLFILKELGRRGLHRTVDTSLYASAETVRAVAAVTELFLVDLKHLDDGKHRQFTGVSNEPILRNVRLLNDILRSQGVKESRGQGVKESRSRDNSLGKGWGIWFRVPLIEGVNADEENIEATARFIDSLRSQGVKESGSQGAEESRSQDDTLVAPRVHLLPYHDVGKDKHRRRGTAYNPDGIPMATPSDEAIERCADQFRQYGIEVIIGG